MATLSNKYTTSVAATIRTAHNITSSHANALTSTEKEVLMKATDSIKRNLQRNGSLGSQEFDILTCYLSLVRQQDQLAMYVKLAHCMVSHPKRDLSEHDVLFLAAAEERIIMSGRNVDELSDAEKAVMEAYQKARPYSEFSSAIGESILSRSSQRDRINQFPHLASVIGSNLDARGIPPFLRAGMADIIRSNPRAFNAAPSSSCALPAITRSDLLPSYGEIRDGQLPSTVADIDVEIDKRVADHEHLLTQIMHNDAILWRLGKKRAGLIRGG
ncbi:hypothetical protein ACHAPU_010202 [Fusarium lateritium]